MTSDIVEKLEKLGFDIDRDSEFFGAGYPMVEFVGRQGGPLAWLDCLVALRETRELRPDEEWETELRWIAYDVGKEREVRGSVYRVPMFNIDDEGVIEGVVV